MISLLDNGKNQLITKTCCTCECSGKILNLLGSKFWARRFCKVSSFRSSTRHDESPFNLYVMKNLKTLRHRNVWLLPKGWSQSQDERGKLSCPCHKFQGPSRWGQDNVTPTRQEHQDCACRFLLMVKSRRTVSLIFSLRQRFSEIDFPSRDPSVCGMVWLMD